MNLDQFTRGYLTAALWLADPDPGPGEWAEHGEYTIASLPPETIARAIDDCAAFQAEHGSRIADDTERAGQDFYLTRNGHGAGFWDGDWPEPAAGILTQAAHVYGTAELYAGDDGRLYWGG